MNPRIAATLMFAALAPLPAAAGTAVSVMQDQAKMVSLTGEAATVVVGNPVIADATVQGTSVFLHGRSFGNTNVIILDAQGNQLAQLDVIVTRGTASGINVFRAGAKYSYGCAPVCESTPEPGDQKDYFTDTIGHVLLKSGAATGIAKTNAQ
jgi:Pilus formation protein N terminal region